MPAKPLPETTTQQPHSPACDDAEQEDPIHYCPRSGIGVTIACSVAFAALLGLSWLCSQSM
jgi:hypothetical protein